MAAPPRSSDLADCSEKLADSSRRTSDGYLYRLSVVTTDGQRATVTWQIDTHQKECKKYVLRQLSHQFRVADPEAALDVVINWTKERLLEHLGTFTAEQLRPPSMRR